MLSDLQRYNPWWSDPGQFQQDPHWRVFQNSRLRWEPALLDQVDLEQDAIYTLRGPRQVGKTTLLKQWIGRLLTRVPDPQAIFYYSCDLLSDRQELFSLLRQYQDICQPRSFPRRYIFLDEVSMLPDWQRAVKAAADLGWTDHTMILATGSSAVDLRRGAEQMPGRRGSPAKLDWLLLPMAFADFLPRTMPELTIPEEGSLDQIREDPSAFAAWRSGWLAFAGSFQLALDQYLKVGGFPQAVESFLQHQRVEESIRQIYSSVVRSDIEKQRRSRNILRNLFTRTVLTEGTPQSWQGLARDAGIGSPNTALDYAEILADSFLLYILYALNRESKTATPRKDKKLYFADPLIRDAVCGELGLPSSGVDRRVEAAVGLHLIRLCERAPQEGLSLLQNVFYWRNSKGREVDFVVRNGPHLIPVEVKYQEQIHAEDSSLIRRSFGGGVLVTKHTCEQSGALTLLPAALFLLLHS